MATRNRTVENLADFLEPDPPEDMGALTALPFAQDNLSSTDEEDLNDIDRVLHEVGAAGQGSTVKVYRVNSTTRKESYLFEVQTAEFNLDVIAQRYGGGTFRVRGYRRNANGGYTPFVNRHIEIEEPRGGIASVNPAAPVVSDRMNEVLNQIASMQQQTQQLIAALAQNGNRQPSRTEMLEEFAMMRNIFGAPAAAAPAADPISQIKQTLELVNLMKGQEAAASDPTTGLLMTMVEKLAGPIAEGIAAQSKNQAQAQAAQGVPSPAGDFAPLPTTFAPLPVPSLAAPQAPKEDMNFIVKQALASVGAAAAKGEPTAPIAEMVANFADKSQDAAQVVAELLNGQDWFTVVENNIPGAAAHKPWYEKLRADLRNLYEDDLPSGE